MRRSLRTLCLLLFLLGLVVIFLDAAGVRLAWLQRNFTSASRTDTKPRSVMALGLILQGTGAAGYLAIAVLWPRRSNSGRSPTRAV